MRFAPAAAALRSLGVDLRSVSDDQQPFTIALSLEEVKGLLVALRMSRIMTLLNFYIKDDDVYYVADDGRHIKLVDTTQFCMSEFSEREKDG